MTRREQQQQTILKLKARLRAAQQSEAKDREQDKAQAKRNAVKARKLRQAQWGTVADDAGLFVWDDGTWLAVVARLAVLVEHPTPVAVLDALLGEELRAHFGTDLDDTDMAPPGDAHQYGNNGDVRVPGTTRRGKAVVAVGESVKNGTGNGLENVPDDFGSSSTTFSDEKA